MKRSNLLVATVAAASLVTLATSASAAAPGALAGAGQALQSDAAPQAVESVRYECWWNYNRRVCSWVRPRPHFGFYWAPPRPRYHGFYGGYGFRRHWR